MSFPTIPPITPDIDIDRDQVVNLVLASIGLEELGLAHMINAAAEELQFILTATPVPPIEDVLKVDRSVEKILRDVIKKEIIMQFKLEDIIEVPSITSTTTQGPPVECECSVRASGEGDITSSPDPDPYDKVMLLGARFCANCNHITPPDKLMFSAIRMVGGPGNDILSMDAILNTVDFDSCDIKENPTPADPSIVVLIGDANVTFNPAVGAPVVGTASFIYTLKDAGGAGNDKIQMIITPDNPGQPELEINTGEVDVNGNVRLESCSASFESIIL